MNSKEMRSLATKDKNGCWIWTYGRFSTGYGRVTHNGRQELAHRASWMAHRGDIPSGLWVLHKCDVKPCINPAHLYLGTASDNVRDKFERGLANIPRGERQHCAKLNEVAVRVARFMVSRKMATRVEIARAYSVSHHIINQAVARKTWRHVA